MGNWTPEQISAFVIAVTGLVTAMGAIVHSFNTRNRLENHAHDNGNDAPYIPGKLDDKSLWMGMS
jgi:hypothetical protein